MSTYERRRSEQNARRLCGDLYDGPERRRQPAAWFASPHWVELQNHKVRYVHQESEIVAQVWRVGCDRGLSDHWRDEETISNTNVIAAARELQHALRILVDHARETYPHFESERGQRNIATAIAALNKSEGKS